MKIEQQTTDNEKTLFEQKRISTELVDLLIELPWIEVKNKQDNEEQLKFYQMFN
jgi:hypothetical protein